MQEEEGGRTSQPGACQREHSTGGKLGWHACSSLSVVVSLPRSGQQRCPHLIIIPSPWQWHAWQQPAGRHMPCTASETPPLSPTFCLFLFSLCSPTQQHLTLVRAQVHTSSPWLGSLATCVRLELRCLVGAVYKLALMVDHWLSSCGQAKHTIFAVSAGVSAEII